MSSRWTPFRRHSSRSTKDNHKGPVSSFLTPRPASARSKTAPRMPMSADRPDAGGAPEGSHPLAPAEHSEDDDNIKVLVRIRPPNKTETTEGYVQFATRSGSSVLVRDPESEKNHHFTFDSVFGETSTQEDLFVEAGLPVVENCISGYNASVFCYGQTGAGKTFTMQGRHLHVKEGKPGFEDRGLMPRVFEHVFTRISEEEDRKGRDNLRYSVRCSFLEIYNENITDLLHPSSKNLQMREDLKTGCYVQGLSEQVVLNGHDTNQLMRKGIENRRVAHTKMNRESSRSHSVLTLTIESKTKNYSGMTVSKFSRLNLIDLAGSERNKASGAEGDRLKEASSINKSLSQLGLVIMRLVEQQRHHEGRSAVHVPYRDSKLTFLLQESLGGNAKTFMIANISPALMSSGETMSTMRFATGAKSIVNKAKVNEEASGDIATLQDVIRNLRQELDMYRNGEAVELRALLSSEQEAKAKTQDEMDKTISENRQLQQRVASLGRQMADADGNREVNETFQLRVTAAMAPHAESAPGSGDLEALAEAVDHSMERLRGQEEAATASKADADTLAKRLGEAEERLVEEAAAYQSLKAEAARVAAERTQLQAEKVKQAAEMARVNEELGAAHLQAKQLIKLSNDRLLEKRKLQETLQIVETTAKAHEVDLLQEIERLESQAVERQDSIVDILAIADRFRNRQQETTTPFKTPAASKSAANGASAAASAAPNFQSRLGGLSMRAPANGNGSSNVPPMSPSGANVRKGSWASRASALPDDNAENDVPSPTVISSPTVQGFGSKSLSGSGGWAVAAAAITPLQDQSNRQRQHSSPSPSPSAAVRTSFADRLSVAIPEFEELLSHGNDDVALNDDSSILSNDGSSFAEDRDYSRPRGNTRYHNTYSNPITSGPGISPALSPVRASATHLRGGTKAQSILRISQALRSKAKALLHGSGQQQTPLAISPIKPSEAA